MPSNELLGACVVACGASTLFSLHWPFTMGNDLHSIDSHLVGFVWVYCLGWFLIQDVAKMLARLAIRKAIESTESEEEKRVRLMQQKRRQMLENALHADPSYQTSDRRRTSMRGGTGKNLKKGEGGGASYSGMSLDQALGRITSLEEELSILREVIQSHTGAVPGSKKSKSGSKKSSKKKKEGEEDHFQM